MKKVRLGIIGCGGRSKAHIRNFDRIPEIEVVAVADPIEERRNSTADLFGCKNIYKNHTELLDNAKGNIDALLICVEPTAHDDMELRAAEMGIPFLVEKPMSNDLDLCERVLKAVEEKHLITSVGFQDRYQDLTDIMMQKMSERRKGGLVYGSWIGGIPGVWWWQKKEYCGGQLLEQNIHLLDILRYFYGEPLSIYATATTGMIKAGVDCSAEYDTDDHSTVVLRFPENVTATLVSGCYVKPKTGKRPRCGLYISMEDIVLDYRLRNNLIIETSEMTIDIPRKEDQVYTLDKAFIDAIITGNRSLIRSDYADAMKTLRLAFAANESMESGQVIYFNK
ncbi:MAG: Gfo/Idh/MocA family oxidoreductase [Ruminococcaceae bacterium]|nr:Gfo/Idh/MocA family oxidoreductase [Oscillospiraceae bacterium]